MLPYPHHKVVILAFLLSISLRGFAPHAQATEKCCQRRSAPSMVNLKEDLKDSLDIIHQSHLIKRRLGNALSRPSITLARLKTPLEKTQTFNNGVLAMHRVLTQNSGQLTPYTAQQHPYLMRSLEALFRQTPASLSRDISAKVSTVTYNNLPLFHSYILESPGFWEFASDDPEFYESADACSDEMELPQRATIVPKLQSAGGSTDLFYLKFTGAQKIQSHHARLILCKITNGNPTLVNKISISAHSDIQVINSERILETTTGGAGDHTCINAIDTQSGKKVFKLTIPAKENVRHKCCFIMPDGRHLLVVEEELTKTMINKNVVVFPSDPPPEKKNSNSNSYPRYVEPSVETRLVPHYSYSYHLANYSLREGCSLLLESENIPDTPQEVFLDENVSRESLTLNLRRHMNAVISPESDQKACLTLDYYDDVLKESKLISYEIDGKDTKLIVASDESLIPASTSLAVAAYDPHPFSTFPNVNIPISQPMEDSLKGLVKYAPGTLRNFIQRTPQFRTIDMDAQAFTTPKKRMTIPEHLNTSVQPSSSAEQIWLKTIEEESRRQREAENKTIREDNQLLDQMSSTIVLSKPGQSSINTIIAFGGQYSKIGNTRVNRANRKVYVAHMKDNAYVDGLVTDRLQATPIGRFRIYSPCSMSSLTDIMTRKVNTYILDDNAVIIAPLLGHPSIHIMPKALVKAEQL